MRPAQDEPALSRETKAWDRREPGVESIAVEGGHIGIGDRETYDENIGKALRWLQEQG